MAELRQPTAAQQALVEKWIRMVHSKRAQVERTLNAARAAAETQQWINENGIAYPGGPLFTTSDKSEIELFAKRASRLETLAADLQLGRAFQRPNDAGDDFDIVYRTGTESVAQWEGLGQAQAFPVFMLLVVVGIVALAAAVSTIVGFYMSAQKAETNYKTKVLDFDKWASSQPASTRSAWSSFKKENAKANPSFWSGLTSTLSDLAPLLGIGALVWLIASSRAGSSEPRPRENPRRRAPMSIQSVLFDRDRWMLDDARGWLSDHGYRSRSVEETDRFFRFRQFDPDEAATFRTITLGQGIKAVVAR